MNPNEFGKRLGIGLKIAGRLAGERVGSASAGTSPAPPHPPQASPASNSGHPASSPSSPGYPLLGSREERRKHAHKLTRAAGRGIGGFLRPFGRVGGLLWLEVTGFFFGMFAIYFAQDIWRARLSYAHGPDHTRFLIGIGGTLVFTYLSASSFWRARRR